MKQLLITITALVLVWCSDSPQSATTKEAKPVDPVAEVPAQPLSTVKSQPAEPVAEAIQPETPKVERAEVGATVPAVLGRETQIFTDQLQSIP